MKTFWLLEDVALNTKEYYLLLLLLLLLFLFFLYEQDLHKTFGHMILKMMMDHPVILQTYNIGIAETKVSNPL